MQTSNSDSFHQTAPVQGETRTRMDPEVKAKWVAALRSGEYAQGIGQLHQGGSFCCLGVLCDLHAKEAGLSWQEDGRYLGGHIVTPREVDEWAALPWRNLVIDGLLRGLPEHNDDGKTFAQIADAIEAQL